MVNPFAETPEQKKELALHMHHNGHTWRDICKEVRLSPSTLSKIIKSEAGYVEDSENQLAGKSKETKALALFDENKEPLEVAIELNISTEEAINFYQNFQQIKCLPLEDRRLKLQKEIEEIEWDKNNANSQLMDFKNQISKVIETLAYYNHEYEQLRNQLILMYGQRKSLVGW
jgi:DNA-binding MarR family transcriptional regulator